jgi:hypothetical protein
MPNTRKEVGVRLIAGAWRPAGFGSEVLTGAVSKAPDVSELPYQRARLGPDRSIDEATVLVKMKRSNEPASRERPRRGWGDWTVDRGGVRLDEPAPSRSVGGSITEP